MSKNTLTTEMVVKDIRILADFFLKSVGVKIPENAVYQYLWDKSIITCTYDNCVVMIDLVNRSVSMQETITHDILASNNNATTESNPTELPSLLPSPLDDITTDEVEAPEEYPVEAHERIFESTIDSLKKYMADARSFGYYMYLSPDGAVNYPQNLPSDRRGNAGYKII